jgi:hypothetical protein
MVRRGEKSEVEKFQLFDDENAGSEIVVVERDGRVAGFAQFDEGFEDATIHFIESSESGKGIGSELISWFQENYSGLTTTNTCPTCQKWLESKGFAIERKDRMGNATMWWEV